MRVRELIKRLQRRPEDEEVDCLAVTHYGLVIVREVEKTKMDMEAILSLLR